MTENQYSRKTHNNNNIIFQLKGVTVLMLIASIFFIPSVRQLLNGQELSRDPITVMDVLIICKKTLWFVLAILRIEHFLAQRGAPLVIPLLESWAPTSNQLSIIKRLYKPEVEDEVTYESFMKKQTEPLFAGLVEEVSKLIIVISIKNFYEKRSEKIRFIITSAIITGVSIASGIIWLFLNAPFTMQDFETLEKFAKAQFITLMLQLFCGFVTYYLVKDKDNKLRSFLNTIEQKLSINITEPLQKRGFDLGITPSYIGCLTIIPSIILHTLWRVDVATNLTFPKIVELTKKFSEEEQIVTPRYYYFLDTVP